MWHAWGRGEVFTGFWLGGPEGRTRRRWEDNLKIDRQGFRNRWGLLDSAVSV
jgi:hypothetical protein